MARVSRTHRGFNLIEVVIVLLVLGVLAWLVVPQFSSASNDVRRGSMSASLSLVRGSLELYRIEHHGRYPALRTIAEQLTLPTTPDGATPPTAEEGYDGDYPLGPYLPMIPENPACRTNTVGDGPPGSSAWYYNEATGEFRPNDSAAGRGL